MKRVLAAISLILYVGYISGILLLTYNQCFHLICSDVLHADDRCSKKTAQSSDKALLDKISVHYSSNLYSHTVATGKTKLPNTFSCPVITAKFTLGHFDTISGSAILKPAQPVTQLMPVFLQNCVLRL